MNHKCLPWQMTVFPSTINCLSSVENSLINIYYKYIKLARLLPLKTEFNIQLEANFSLMFLLTLSLSVILPMMHVL